MDSSFLLWAGRQAGADIHPYYIKTAFQPEFEYQDALRLCRELGAELTVLELDALADPQVTANPANRCYFCKVGLFGTLSRRALADGYTVLLDGTNASDDAGDRPGMKALQELQVLSAPAAVWPDQGGDSPPVQRSGPFHLGQACLCLPGHPHPNRGRNYHGKAAGYGKSGRVSVFLGILRLPGAEIGEFRPYSASGGPNSQFDGHRREILTELKKYYKNVLLDLEVRP